MHFNSGRVCERIKKGFQILQDFHFYKNPLKRLNLNALIYAGLIHHRHHPSTNIQSKQECLKVLTVIYCCTTFFGFVKSLEGISVLRKSAERWKAFKFVPTIQSRTKRTHVVTHSKVFKCLILLLDHYHQNVWIYWVILNIWQNQMMAVPKKCSFLHKFKSLLTLSKFAKLYEPERF